MKSTDPVVQVVDKLIETLKETNNVLARIADSLDRQQGADSALHRPALQGPVPLLEVIGRQEISADTGGLDS